MKAKPISENDLSTLAAGLGVTLDDLLSHCRKAELVDARSMTVALLIEHAHMRQKEVAPLLNITQSAVSWLLIRHRQMMKHPGGNPDYQQRYADFEAHCTLRPHCGLDPQSPKRDGDTNTDDPDQ